MAVWLLSAAVLAFVVPAADPGRGEQPSFLPEWTPSRRAAAALAQYFPSRGGLSEAVVVFERASTVSRSAVSSGPNCSAETAGAPLGEEDWRVIEQIASRIGRPRPPLTPKDLENVIVRTPLSLPLPKTPLIADDRQAALIVVGIPANFITIRSARIVEHIERVLKETRLPAGLSAAITGSSGFGHDYALAAHKSERQTFYVTIAAVVVILLLVYRAPVAALIPLTAISLAAVIAIKLLDLGGRMGMHAGTAERIFVVVLLYGAGTDYALLLMSRCHEFLDASFAPRAAAAAGLSGTMSAILASGGTNIAGLMMLVFAQYGIFRTTGPAVALALLVAMLACLTLVPAVMAVAGRRLFWPGKHIGGIGQKRLWPGVARLVTRRPAWVLVAVLGLLAAPAVQGTRITWMYDTLAFLSEDYQAIRGLRMAMRHWPVGEIAPLTVLIESPKGLSSQQWDRLAGRVTRAISRVEAVKDIRSLTQPVGATVGEIAPTPQPPAATRAAASDPSAAAPATAPASAPAAKPAAAKGGLSFLSGLAERATQPGRGLLGLLASRSGPDLGLTDIVKKLRDIGRGQIDQEYVSPDWVATRLVVILDKPPLGLEAMAAVNEVRQAARQALEGQGVSTEVHLAGITAEILDLRSITSDDFYRIAALVLAVIVLLVLALLRDLWLSLFMVASTVASYLATLGLTYWFFRLAYGMAGLDWKVEVFLFVVMVAVGQDYNIFLAARLAQEARHHDPKEATGRAIVHTGPVISSCGLIMAATLGSLAAGDLILLIQLGFSLALGMLIDTFIIRPLLLPSFVVLTGRTGRPL